MDTVTHALIGMGIAEVGFRRRLGGSAILGGALFGALPDLDLLSYWVGEGLRYHRAETHSLILTAAAAPLFGLLISRLTHKKDTFLPWTGLSLLALWSHAILDLLTSWGTEILAPFDRTRYALDALPLIDPLFSVPLLIAGLCCLIKRRALSRPLAAAVLGWCALYAAFGLYNNHKACALALAALPGDFAPAQTRAIPAMGTVFYWNVVSRSQHGGVAIHNVSTWKKQVTVIKAPPATASPAAARRFLESRTGRLLCRTSRGMLSFAEVPATGNLLVTDLRYLRYASGDASAFHFRREFAPAGPDWVEVAAQHAHDRTKRALLGEMKTVWRQAFF